VYVQRTSVSIFNVKLKQSCNLHKTCYFPWNTKQTSMTLQASRNPFHGSVVCLHVKH